MKTYPPSAPFGERDSRTANDLQPHGDDAALHHAEAFGRRARNIDDSGPVKRPSVVDAYDHRSSVVSIGDFDQGAKRQRRMGGGKFVPVIAFAGSCCSPVKLAAVIRGVPDIGITRVLGITPAIPPRTAGSHT